jgi:putative transposase
MSERYMYRWRRMTQEQRDETLAYRRKHLLPWHSPPHYASDTSYYLITAACFGHRPRIGYTPERMADFEAALLGTFAAQTNQVFAWVVLPNHYHALIQSLEIKGTLAALGELHGRTSFTWNGIAKQRGRQVWCGAAETAMKSERHYWATLLYVLNNPVRHGYVEKWQDWPYSNAVRWLEDVGHERAARMWREYPIDSYGDGWDPPDL